MDLINSYMKGFVLGGGIVCISVFIDTTFCKQTHLRFNMLYPNLYLESLHANFKNMILVGPITYSLVDNLILDHNSYNIQIINLSGLLLIHNSMYYMIHYLMHKPFLYKIHKFHHQYDNFLLPSFGNAVSIEEFLLAYMFPFITGAYYLKPNEITFILSISVIALLNIVIHTQDLENVKWVKYLVSPNNHITHHKIKNKHYSAPLLNFDYCLEQLTKKIGVK